MNDKIPGKYLKVWTIHIPISRNHIKTIIIFRNSVPPSLYTPKRKNNPGNHTESWMKNISSYGPPPPLKMKQLLHGFLCCDGVVFHGDVGRYQMWRDRIFLVFRLLGDWSHTLMEGLCIWLCHNSRSMSCVSSWSSPFWFFALV